MSNELEVEEYDERKDVIIALADLQPFLKGLESRITVLEKKLDEVDRSGIFFQDMTIARLRELKERVDKIDGGKDHPMGSRIDWELSTLKSRITGLERTLKPTE